MHFTLHSCESLRCVILHIIKRHLEQLGFLPVYFFRLAPKTSNATNLPLNVSSLNVDAVLFHLGK